MNLVEIGKPFTEAQKLLASSNELGPTIEIGGPTPRGYELCGGELQDAIITNIDGSNYLVDGRYQTGSSSLLPEDSSMLDLLADGRRMPFRDNSIGMVVMSAITMMPETIAKQASPTMTDVMMRRIESEKVFRKALLALDPEDEIVYLKRQIQREQDIKTQMISDGRNHSTGVFEDSQIARYQSQIEELKATAARPFDIRDYDYNPRVGSTVEAMRILKPGGLLILKGIAFPRAEIGFAKALGLREVVRIGEEFGREPYVEEALFQKPLYASPKPKSGILSRLKAVLRISTNSHSA